MSCKLPQARSSKLQRVPKEIALCRVAALLVICACTDSTAPASDGASSIDALTPSQLTGAVVTNVTPSPTVRVTDRNGNPVSGVVVSFRVTAGGGTATPLNRFGTSSAWTDHSGTATAEWKLGPQAATNTLSVGVGTLAPAVFTALATAGPLAQLAPDEGNDQVAAPGSTLPRPLRAKATDAFENPIAGVLVTFSVISGEGTIERPTAVSDSAGLATSGQWTLGPSPGWQHARAQSADLQAVFTAETACLPERVESSCPESGQLVFLRPTDGQIYRVGANGAGLTRLTTSVTIGESDYRASSPVWSPDGRRIAFAIGHAFGSVPDLYCCAMADIYLMDADGSNVVRRTTGSRFFSVAWSPDGRQLAVSNGDEYFPDTYLISAEDDGSLPVLLASDARSPAWSPDGKKIAFLRTGEDDGNDEIYVINADGTGLEPLTSGGGYRSGPTWSPDGRRMAFSSCLAGSGIESNCDVYVMNSDGSGLQPITRIGNAYGVAWSSDGELIALTLGGAISSVAYVPVAGGTPRVVVSDATSASWRP